MNDIPFAQIGLALFLLGALIAAGVFGFHFLRKSSLGKQIGIPERRARRLGIIERAHLDNGRKLLLVRRDNIEHLVMIGGPIDVLVETGIERPRVHYERPKEGADGLNRYQSDWGLHCEPPPGSEKSAYPVQPELSLPATRPQTFEGEITLDPKPQKESNSIQ